MVAGRPSKQLQILHAARELFSDFGYQGTSIDLVVQRAGVSKPTVYNHFNTKQELLQQLLEQLSQEASHYREGLSSKYQHGDINGLCASFRYITATPAHLASYRILAGERFKLSSSLADDIAQLDRQHIDWCRQWLTPSVDAQTIELLISICQSALVYPALMGSDLMSDHALRKRLRVHL